MNEIGLSPRLAITVTNAGNDKKIKEAFTKHNADDCKGFFLFFYVTVIIPLLAVASATS